MAKQSTSPFPGQWQSVPAPVDFYDPGSYSSDNSVGYLMRRIMLMLVNQADKRLECLDLTQAQWGPLFLIHQGRATTLAELSRELQIDAGALTRTRERSTSDRRVVKLALTPEGQAAAACVPQVLADVHNHLLAGFSKDEWQTLMSLLRRALSNAEAMRDGCEFGPSADGSERGQ